MVLNFPEETERPIPSPGILLAYGAPAHLGYVDTSKALGYLVFKVACIGDVVVKVPFTVTATVIDHDGHH
jgi:hypothetical protein